jgi:hypothetical protein
VVRARPILLFSDRHQSRLPLKLPQQTRPLPKLQIQIMPPETDHLAEAEVAADVEPSQIDGRLMGDNLAAN